MGHLAQYGVMLPILPATDPVSDWWVEMSQYSGTESVVDTGIVNTTKINSSAMVVVPGGLTLLWCYWHPSIDGPLHYYYYNKYRISTWVYYTQLYSSHVLL